MVWAPNREWQMGHFRGKAKCWNEHNTLLCTIKVNWVRQFKIFPQSFRSAWPWTIFFQSWAKVARGTRSSLRATPTSSSSTPSARCKSPTAAFIWLDPTQRVSGTLTGVLYAVPSLRGYFHRGMFGDDAIEKVATVYLDQTDFRWCPRGWRG